MRKFNGKSNLLGQLIENALKKKNMKKQDFCKKLQLMGINIEYVHLFRIIKGTVILKDFELLAMCKILDLDYDELKNLVDDKK